VAADHEVAAAFGVCMEMVRSKGGEGKGEAAAAEIGAPAMEVLGAGEGG